MTENKVLLTKEGYNKLQEELDYLVMKKRGEVTENLKKAKSFGDLSENSEYDEARNEQAKVEARILEITQQLKNAKIISTISSKNDTVSIGDKVLIQDLSRDKEIELTIVGTIEADVASRKISNESPLGKALLNSKVDDLVTVKTKVNTVQYKVKKIVR